MPETQCLEKLKQDYLEFDSPAYVMSSRSAWDKECDSISKRKKKKNEDTGVRGEWWHTPAIPGLGDRDRRTVSNWKSAVLHSKTLTQQQKPKGWGHSFHTV